MMTKLVTPKITRVLNSSVLVFFRSRNQIMASTPQIDAAAHSVAEYVSELVHGDHAIQKSLKDQYKRWIREASASSVSGTVTPDVRQRPISKPVDPSRSPEPEQRPVSPPSPSSSPRPNRQVVERETSPPAVEKREPVETVEEARRGAVEALVQVGEKGAHRPNQEEVQEEVHSLQGACIPLEENGDSQKWAYIQIDLHRDKGLTLEVHCARFLRLHRKTYVKAVGYGLRLIEDTLGPRPLERFSLQMHPRPQLNLIIALGCLGYFIESVSARDITVVEKWPSQPVSSAEGPAVMPDAHAFQFQTVWRQNKFFTSYYNLVDSEFKWVHRSNLFEADVATQKKRRLLKLRPLDLASLHHEPEITPIYLEYRRHDGAPIGFFGTVGDVLAKYDLLKDASAGQRQLASSSMYYAPREKHLVIVALLNKQHQPPMPSLTVDNVNWLPAAALQNLAKLWTPKTYGLMTQRQKGDPAFLSTMFQKVPPKVKRLLTAGASDPSTRGILALSLYTNLMEKKQ